MMHTWVQSLSTGTHGTGLQVGNMATFITKLKFVSGKGEVRTQR